MPRQFLPKLSGEHRIACFALYRALLEQCPRLQSLVDTLPGQPNQLQHLIRKQFLRNRHDTSHRLVVIALQKGYEAEELLRTAGDGDSTAQTKVKDILLKLEEEREKSRKANAASPKVPREKPRMWPYPGYISTIFQRPLPTEKLSGRRHIPVINSANSIPYIRIKKPQPEFLSRVIRNKIDQRQRRNDSVNKMDEEYSWAANEDAWDRLVANVGYERGEKSWGDDITVSKQTVERRLMSEQREIGKVAWKLLDITNQEKKLRAKEKREHLRSKKRGHRDQGPFSGEESRGFATTSVQRDYRDQADRWIPPTPKNGIGHSSGREAASLQQRFKRGEPSIEGKVTSIAVASTRDSSFPQFKVRRQLSGGEASHQEAPSQNSQGRQISRRVAPVWRSKPNP